MKIDDKNSDKQNVAKEETKLQAATDFNEYVSKGSESQRERQTVANYERRQTEFEKELDQDQGKLAISDKSRQEANSKLSVPASHEESFEMIELIK